MRVKGKEISSPVQSRYSFFKVFELLEKQIKSDDKNLAAYASSILDECEKYPELRDGFEDHKLLKKYQVPINKLMQLIFPEVLTLNEIKGVSGPFDFTPFYISTRFENILTAAGEDFSFELGDIDPDLLYQFGCLIVLGAHFKFPVDVNTPHMFDIPNKKKGVIDKYKMAFNADVTEIIPTENSLDITHNDYLELLDNFGNIKLWKEKIPPNSWIIRGIGVLNLMNVTMEESLGDITSNLLLNQVDAFDKIQTSFRTLLKHKDLEIGFIKFKYGVIAPPDDNEPMTSILLKSGSTIDFQEFINHQNYQHLINESLPIVISDVEKFDEQNQSSMSKTLRELKIESYIICPLIHEGQLIAFQELASRKKYQLNSTTLIKINPVLPILAIAASRFRMEAQNLREAIIQHECTTIHPSVKWRFDEEADKYMFKQQNGGHPSFKDIIFRDVYPLYGQMDIKSSSTIRNKGVQSDLVKQIDGVKEVLSVAYSQTNMSIYEELIFRIDSYKDDILDGLSAGSEHKTMEFINKEIKPVFEQLKGLHGNLAEKVSRYNEILHPELNMVYDERKRFDESAERINNTLAKLLDDKQKEAQLIFPHYFERYKTDGVEYNIYIGGSISKKQNFDPIYLRNLQMWQLVTMCEMEQKYYELKTTLSTPLEIASLILVYSTPMAIHFRMDEKRFDVEGAYNARYEVLKKRVDKAHIKGTKDRITVPNKIAIIYSNEEDAKKYRTYIKYLEQKKYIKPDSLEELNLEDLQGISVLKALRIEMAYSTTKKKEVNLTIDEIENGLISK